MKSIEPDCKAMIVFSVNFPELIGTVLNVGMRAEEQLYINKLTGESYWLTGWNTDFIGPDGDGVWAERCLMRIDEEASISPSVTEKSEVL